jgi:hypothetical protein
MTRIITTEIIINRFKKKHGTRFGYDKVIYKSAKDKVLIYCFESDDKYGIHAYFLQTPDNHSKGRTCPKCTGHYRMNITDFIEISQQIHENKYSYDLVDYVNTSIDVIITCKKHGSFPQRPSSHLSGAGCKKCSDQITHDNQRKSKEQFIFEVYQLYGNSIDCSNSNYINSQTELEIKCIIHKITFTKKPCVLLAGHGCPECSGKYFKLTTEIFIKKSKEIHGDEYDYSKVIYTKSNECVIISCKIHGDFNQTPNSHLSGSGCNECGFIRFLKSRKRYYSKIQIVWLTFQSILNNITIQHAENGGEFKIKNTNFLADGFCKETNTIYEFHGDYWHGNPNIYNMLDINQVSKKTFGELYQKTLEREQLIRDMGFNLVVMWESDWNKINNSIRILQRLFRNSKHR